MKNSKLKLFTKLFAILAGCLLLASFSPSLDGRAVVVDDGVFPQGLFAKTVGYLPGDIISVTSIGGESTVDLLVIGALDPSEGVAIMLSPEAAKAIGIEKRGNSIVKITKRSSQDERVYGSAVIAMQNNAENKLDENSVDIPLETNILAETIEETEYDEGLETPETATEESNNENIEETETEEDTAGEPQIPSDEEQTVYSEAKEPEETEEAEDSEPESDINGDETDDSDENYSVVEVAEPDDEEEF